MSYEEKRTWVYLLSSAAAYGVYLVLVLGAQAFRMVVVPDLTRAEAEGRLGSEFRAYALAFLAVAVYAQVIEPGRPQAFYSAAAPRIAGWSAPLGGAVSSDGLP